jgi:hypothetical protein
MEASDIRYLEDLPPDQYRKTMDKIRMEYTPERIRNMSMTEYAEFRAQFMPEPAVRSYIPPKIPRGEVRFYSPAMEAAEYNQDLERTRSSLWDYEEDYNYWLELYVKTGELSHLNNMLEKVEAYG